MDNRPYSLQGSSYSMRNFYPCGRCIMLDVSQETAQKIHEFTHRHGITQNYSFDGNLIPGTLNFHVTVLYTQTPIGVPTGVIEYREPFEIYPTGYDMFSECIPVMLVSGDRMHSIRKTYQDLYDFDEDFPDWKPHLSLSYDSKYDSNMRFVTERLPLPDFPLIVDRLRIEEAK